MYIDIEHLADALDDGQAEAEPLDILVARMANAVELLEHLGQMFGGDAAPLVVDHHGQSLALAPHADQYGLAGCVFERVGQQVLDHRGQQAGIDADPVGTGA
ncbi:hypothetical protein D3C78_1780860 [compost metagenome]